MIGRWRGTSRRAGWLAGTAIGSLASATALASPPQIQTSTDQQIQSGGQPSTSSGPFSFLNGISRSQQMLGDMWGLRPFLSGYGITLNLTETSEVLGNVSGGNSTGFRYDGLTTLDIQMDTGRAFGWHRGTFNVSGLQIHGRNLSADKLFTLQTASGIEADRATRLWELWYDQKFLEEDRLDVKVGQQSLDQEFIVSNSALLFVNTMFGWPMVPSADLPGGGPAYPLSALGVRVRGTPIDGWTVLGGVFNGTPAANNPIWNAGSDSQQVNNTGTRFGLDGGVLAIAELQYSFPSLGTMLYANQQEPLARTYKLGVWYDTESFADQLVDNTGTSLANPATTGIPQQHRGDYSIYAVADQAVWQDPEESDRGITLFMRAMGTPEVDRNPIVFSLNVGGVFHEPFLGRDDDTFGVGLGWAKVSPRASSLDNDTAVFTGGLVPIRSSETFIELTYQYEVVPWLQLQPDFQYVFNPGGGVANAAGTSKIGDEAVIGVRANIVF